jgi:ABC-2 type transport system permease protein
MGIPVFMPLIFLSGIFYPTQTFPRFLQDVTNFIPTAWASTIVKGIFFKGKSLFDYPDEFIKLVAFSFGTIIIGSYFLKRTLKQSG